MVVGALVVDDERLAREELCFLLESYPDLKVIAQAKNGIEAIELAKKHQPDLMFLDVQMPGMNGFQVVEKLLAKGVRPPKIIFVTAYDQYALRAFDINAMDYLLKPVDKHRLERAIARVREQLASPGKIDEQLRSLIASTSAASVPVSKLLIRAYNRMLLIDSSDIVYATVEGGIISIVTQDFVGTSNYRTLEELHANLDPKIFWRVHRAYLVNLNKIKEVIPWFNRAIQLRMNDRKQTEVPVSRTQARRLREFLKM